MRKWRTERLVAIYNALPTKVVDILTPNKWEDLQILRGKGLIEIETSRYEKNDMVVKTQLLSSERFEELFCGEEPKIWQSQ